MTLLKEGKRTFGNAQKVVADIIGDLGDDAVKYVTTAGRPETNPFFGKVVGMQAKDDPGRYWRIDFDDPKGAHVNWNLGKAKGAVLIEGGREQVDRIIKNVLNE